VKTFDVLASAPRRRILALLALGEATAGALATALAGEFGLSQPGASQHLRVLREAGFAAVRREGARRVYALTPDAFAELDGFVEDLRGGWMRRMDALGLEIARGRRAERESGNERVG
jgi:DNA-binding transcriptional ArsR family regulator